MPSGKGENAEGVWQEENCARWNEWLYGYDQAIASLENGKLAELDWWYREEFPLLLVGRVPPYVQHDELLRVTAWKMHRGVWRERNRHLVASNDPLKVEEISREALAAVPDPRKPVALLATLSGVGPATASAVLAAHAPHIYPFFDEAVAHNIPGLGPVAFSIPYYLRYAEAIRERAHRLNATCSSRGWSAQDVAQALWALDTSSARR